MSRVIAGLLLYLVVPAEAAERLYEISGKIEPPVEASVSIFGASEPFAEAALADRSGRFHFSKLKAGAYTLAAIAPGRGEARLTVEAGPGTVESNNRVLVSLRIPDAERIDLARRHSVSTSELRIPERAWREYRDAETALSRRDAESARKHFEAAVSIAPRFATAWNNLGTIAYQAGQFEGAAECFQKALAADPTAYEPLVNLGGVLINLNRFEEARKYNQHAVLLRERDALANSQLGLTYFELGDDSSAEKYLRRASEIDPAHFSHPQLVLAQIHIRRNQPAQAAVDLENFLTFHPDAPNAAELRRDISLFRR